MFVWLHVLYKAVAIIALSKMIIIYFKLVTMETRVLRLL